MRLLVLSRADVKGLLPMRECIDLMAETLAGLARGELEQPVRSVVRPEGAAGLLGLMPAYRSRPEPAFGLKAITVFGRNPARGLDSHQGLVMLFDGETGQALAVADASAVTEIRTAAVSAVATRTLARGDACELAILGSGVQARSHLASLSEVRQLRRARVWSRTPEHRERLAREADGRFGFPVEAVSSAAEALDGADVVVTATTSAEPIVERGALGAGAHVNAVGAYQPTTRELDSATVADSAFFVDSREATATEAGEYVLALAEGAIRDDHVRGELGEVLASQARGRISPGEITVFKSLGLAVEDLAAVEHMYGRARATGAGAAVQL